LTRIAVAAGTFVVAPGRTEWAAPLADPSKSLEAADIYCGAVEEGMPGMRISVLRKAFAGAIEDVLRTIRFA
jgi:hypothetical protein